MVDNESKALMSELVNTEESISYYNWLKFLVVQVSLLVLNARLKCVLKESVLEYLSSRSTYISAVL